MTMLPEPLMLPGRAWRATGPLSALVALLLPASALTGASLPDPAPAAANLVVTPTRIVLEGRARSAEVYLHNSGDAPGTYRISLIEKDMDVHGHAVAKAEAEAGTSAASLLRYSPKQVVLAPGATQTVRIQVRKPEHLPAGEYRSHFLFRAVPEVPETPGAASGSGISVSIKAIFGVSIPVIVRHGQVQAKGTLSHLSLRQDGGRRVLDFHLNREGNRSLYGDLLATWQPRGGKPVAAGKLNGVAIYANLPVRKMSLPLAEPNNQTWGPGTLKVSYREPGTQTIIAEASLELR